MRRSSLLRRGPLSPRLTRESRNTCGPRCVPCAVLGPWRDAALMGAVIAVGWPAIGCRALRSDRWMRNALKKELRSLPNA